jgi:hypothetical protein
VFEIEEGTACDPRFWPYSGERVWSDASGLALGQTTVRKDMRFRLVMRSGEEAGFTAIVRSAMGRYLDKVERTCPHAEIVVDMRDKR